MIMDERLEFADAVSIAASAGTALIGDQLDMSLPNRDVGMGEPVYLVIEISTTVASGGSATVQFRLRSDSTAAIHATTSTGHIDTGALALATLVAGYTLVIPLPMGINYEEFLGLQVITGTATTTAGAINAFLTLDPHGWTALPDAVN